MILGSGILGGNPLGGSSFVISTVVIPPVTDWITFDPVNNRIILHVPTTTTEAIYAAWVVWAAKSENLSYAPVFRVVGGDSIGNGVSIAIYYFLLNGWRVRPMEANHTCIISGNLVVNEGGDQVVPTLGAFNVLVKLLVPAAAQAVNTGGSLYTVTDIANAVWMQPVSTMTNKTTIGGYISRVLLNIPKFLGLK